MQESWSYAKDSADFIRKIGQIRDSIKSAILVAADVVSLYPSIKDKAVLKALKNALKTENKSIFLLKN